MYRGARCSYAGAAAYRGVEYAVSVQQKQVHQAAILRKITKICVLIRGQKSLGWRLNASYTLGCGGVGDAHTAPANHDLPYPKVRDLLQPCYKGSRTGCCEDGRRSRWADCVSSIGLFQSPRVRKARGFFCAGGVHG